MWQRQDTLSPNQRKIMKDEFIKSLISDPSRKWKPVIIDGIQTEYMISDMADLASLRMCRMMKPAKNASGYWETVIRVGDKKVNVSIHRLVAQAHIPNPDNLPEVNHKNGDKDKNWASNLEWMSHADNVIHSIETGLRDNYLPEKRYTKGEIHKVCQMLEKGKSVSTISKKTGVSKQVIRSIRRGKSWKHISKKYNISRPVTRPADIDLKEQASTTIQSDYLEEIVEFRRYS